MTGSRMVAVTRRRMLGGVTMAGVALGAGMPWWANAQGVQGYSWTQVPFGGGGYVDGFVWHPKEKGLLYTRTDVGGAYRYEPATRSWTPLLDHLGRDEADLMGVMAIALDPTDPEKVHLACGEYVAEWAQPAAVLTSTDRGRSWRKTTLPIKLAGNGDGRGGGERLQVDPNLPSTLLLGTSVNGLYRSDDGGASFHPVSAFPAREGTFVLFDAASGTAGTASATVYVGGNNGNGTGAVYVSHDGGKGFTMLDGSPKLVPQRAALDAKGNLFVTFLDGGAPAGGKDGGVWKRDAATGKWKDISPMKPGTDGVHFGYCGIDIHPMLPGLMICSTMNRWAIHDDIYLSRDGGESWKPLGPKSRHNPAGYPWLVNYLKGEDWMGHWIGDVRFDPFDPETIIYGTGYGVWMTRNLGALDKGGEVLFDFEVRGLEETCAIDFKSPSGGAILLASLGDVSGGAYDDLSRSPKNGLFAPTSESTRSVDSAELAPRLVVRTVDGDRSGYFSKDGGASWQAFPSSPRVINGRDGWHGGGTIAISAKGSSLVWCPDKQTGYVSKDWGKSWQECQGWPSGADAQLVPIADRGLDAVFYLYDRKASILISVDGGASFQTVANGVPKTEGWQGAQLAAAPGRPRDLWLAGPWGLLHGDGPDKPIKQIKDVNEGWLVSLGKGAPGAAYPLAVYLYGKVKGVEGIWRSDDAGANWVRINLDTQRYGALRAMAADSLEYGTVYIGPHGRGIVMGKFAR